MLMREQAGAAKAANAQGTAQAAVNWAQEANISAQTAETQQRTQFAAAMQPALARLSLSQAIMSELGQSKARNEATIQDFLGSGTPIVRNATEFMRKLSTDAAATDFRKVGSAIQENIKRGISNKTQSMKDAQDRRNALFPWKVFRER